VKPISVKPGGRLTPDLSAGTVGLSDHVILRDFRRDLDVVVRAEGHIKFAPNPLVSEATQSEPAGADGPITVISEVTLASGRYCAVCGTKTQLWAYFGEASGYVEGSGSDAYVNEYGGGYLYWTKNTGNWELIGSGFSADGRWESVQVGSWLVLNNGVDLPLTYRVGETSAKPIYELREAGIASVGTIVEISGILVALDIRQISSTKHLELMSPIVATGNAAVGGATSSGIAQAKVNSGVDGVAGNKITATNSTFNGGAGFVGLDGRMIRMANGLKRVIASSPAPTPTTATLIGAATVCEPNQPFYILASEDTKLTVSLETLFPGVFTETLTLAQSGGRWEDGPSFTKIIDAGKTYRFTIGNATSIEYYKPGDLLPTTLTASGDFYTEVGIVEIFGPFLATWNGKIERIDHPAVGLKLLWDSGEIATIRRVEGGFAYVLSDSQIASGPLAIENPAAYAAFTNNAFIERIQSRAIWSMPNLPRRWAATYPCLVDPTTNLVRLKYPMKSLTAGMDILMVGAGAGGGNLTAPILFAFANQILLADAAVTNAAALIQQTITDAVAAEATTLAFKLATSSTLSLAQQALDKARTESALDDDNADLKKAEADASAAADIAQVAYDAAVKAYDTAVAATITAKESLQPIEATIVAADAEASIAGLFDDLEGDGSAIVRALKLGGFLAVYKTSGSFFLGRYTGNVSAPFLFDEVKVPIEACMPLKYKHAIISLSDVAHIYAAESDFYIFDTTSRLPRLFEPLRFCKSIFFNSDPAGAFACNNAVTKEVMFCVPSSSKPDKAICYDIIEGKARTTSVRWHAGATLRRPKTSNSSPSEVWFVGAHDAGLMRYGKLAAEEVSSASILATKPANTDVVTATGAIFTTDHIGRSIRTTSGKLFAISGYTSATQVTVIGSGSFTAEAFVITPSVWHRDGAAYDSVMQSGMDDFGSAHAEKVLNEYVILLSSESPNTPVLVQFLGGVKAASPAVIQSATITSPQDMGLLKPTLVQYYIGVALTVSGMNNPFELAGQIFNIVPVNSRSWGRKGNGV
jgi:hypothetical protein